MDYYFDFAETTVTSGTTVLWTNYGAEPHTATASDLSFQSPILASGEAFSSFFAQPGEFRYHCEIHPTMEGVIYVTAAETAPDPSTSQPLQPTAVPIPPAAQPTPAAPREAPTQIPSLPAPIEVLPTVTLQPFPTPAEPELQPTAPVPTSTPVRPTAAPPPSAVPTLEPSPTVRPTVGSTAPSSAAVEVGDNYYRPQVVTVARGGSVTWNNRGQTAHTASSINREFDTQTISPGQSRTITFSNAGSFNYRCNFHSNMNGTVIVQ
jgi:plastocyanin